MKSEEFEKLANTMKELDRVDEGNGLDFNAAWRKTEKLFDKELVEQGVIEKMMGLLEDLVDELDLIHGIDIRLDDGVMYTKLVMAVSDMFEEKLKQAHENSNR